MYIFKLDSQIVIYLYIIKLSFSKSIFLIQWLRSEIFKVSDFWEKTTQHG